MGADPATMAAAAGGGALVGGLGGLIGSRSMRNAIGRAEELTRLYGTRALGEYSNALNQATGTLNPYIQLGQRSMAPTEEAARRYVNPTLTGFTPQNYFNDPGYQFELGQGEGAINRAAAARGNFFSPATTQGLLDYGQGLASTRYNEAFNRYLTEGQAQYGQQLGSQQQYYNQLANLLGIGVGAGSQLAGTQFGTGQLRGQTQMQIGSDLSNLALGRGSANPYANFFQGAVSGAGAGLGAAGSFS